ncbi:TPA: hypothetical protein ACI7NC_005018, partial [Escherichia coli]
CARLNEPVLSQTEIRLSLTGYANIFSVVYEDKKNITYNAFPIYPWRRYGVRCVGYCIYSLVLFSLIF